MIKCDTDEISVKKCFIVLIVVTTIDTFTIKSYVVLEE